MRNRADRWLARRHIMVSQLVDAEPDVISLQEIYFPIRQGQWLRNQINLRVSGSKRGPYKLIQRRKKHWVNGYYEGVGVLSKLPILFDDYVSLGYGGRIGLRVNVQLPSHQTLDFVSVHLHHVAHDKEARREQVMTLLGWLKSRRHNPLQVIAGDFNELPDGLAIQTMRQSYRSAYADVNGRDPLATFPTALVDRQDGWAGCLDYVFVSSAVHEVETAVIFCDKPSLEDASLYPSDHVGLLAKIRV